MPPKTAAIVRWTGRGSIAGLRSSVVSVLRCNDLRGRVWSAGNSVVVEGEDPLRVAASLRHLPGVAWVGAGLAFHSIKEAAPTAGWLARRYLKLGDRFTVDAEGTGGTFGSDVAGAVTSGILDAVKGARVSESAKAKFRAAHDGRRGVVGVEVAGGPGGVTVGGTWATCLVSGGIHSSVLAWSSLLLGYRTRLVHARAGEAPLLAVARLYAELSHRVDPQALKLEVVEGGAMALAERLAEAGGDAFGGFRPTSGRVPSVLSELVTSPLFLMPEEQFLSQFESLDVKADDSEARWEAPAEARFAIRVFEGWAADVSSVLDGLR